MDSQGKTVALDLHARSLEDAAKLFCNRNLALKVLRAMLEASHAANLLCQKANEIHRAPFLRRYILLWKTVIEDERSMWRRKR